MFKLISIINAILVLPFAVGVLAAPHFMFDQFGIDLGPEGGVVARGYGATALGWGIACLLMRDSKDPAGMRAITLGSIAFNGAEVLVQVPVALSGIASPMIWSTIVGHLVAFVLSMSAWFRGLAGARL